MLTLHIDETELYNEQTNELITIKPTNIVLEHSLVSLSKWESKWHIPFLHTREKTPEMVRDYVRCMTITQQVNPIVFLGLKKKHYDAINSYIEDPMTATWFSDNNKKASREIITAELIYYSMIQLGIPVEFQKWHLNRLLTLIRVCTLKNQPSKKMSKRDWAKKQHALNQARHKKH